MYLIHYLPHFDTSSHAILAAIAHVYIGSIDIVLDTVKGIEPPLSMKTKHCAWRPFVYTSIIWHCASLKFWPIH